MAGSYDQSCDVWSCGVMMFIMLCGYPPFYGSNDADVLAWVKAGNFTFDHNDWKGVSRDAINLITSMLKKDPEKRLTAEQTLDHVWIKNKAPEALDMALNWNAMRSLKNFVNTNHFKKAALTVIATNLGDTDIKALRELFMSLDVNGDGKLTAEEMKAGM